MAKIKLNLNEAKPEVVEVKEEIKPEPVKEIVKSFKNKQPCLWHITQLDDGTIQAVNSSSGEYFKGSRADFNKCMRG